MTLKPGDMVFWGTNPNRFRVVNVAGITQRASVHNSQGQFEYEIPLSDLVKAEDQSFDNWMGTTA